MKLEDRKNKGTIKRVAISYNEAKIQLTMGLKGLSQLGQEKQESKQQRELFQNTCKFFQRVHLHY